MVLPEKEAGKSLAWDAVTLDVEDNVAVALRDISGDAHVLAGESIKTVPLLSPIAMGHKLALRRIGQGESVIKYGERIGDATAEIGVGEHVHVHNLKSRRARTA